GGVDHQHRLPRPGRQRQLAAAEPAKAELVRTRIAALHQKPPRDVFGDSITALSQPRSAAIAARHFGCAAPVVHRDCGAFAGEIARMIAALLLKGFVVGIVIAVPVGPVGVLCIRRTILEGRVAGLSSGTGAATADAMFAVIAGFGLTALSDWLFGYQDWLRVGGAAFLFYVGFSAFMHDPAKPRTPQQAPDSLLANGASTFALTITNPVTILSFLAIFAGLGLTGREMTMAGVATLVFGVWLGSLSWWV